MDKNLLIELLETGEKVSLYSPRFEGEEYTEFEKFLLTYKDLYAKDIQIITIIGTNLHGPLEITIDIDYQKEDKI